MRVDGFEQEELWTTYGFYTTYKINWEHCLAYIYTVFDYLNQVEILVTDVGASNPKAIEIKTKDDIWNIPESGAIYIRGNSKVYDGVPMQHKFFNQTDRVLLEIPTAYVNSLKKNKDELLDVDGKKHTFDKYIDSVEINGEASYWQQKHFNDVSAIISAITTFKDFNSEIVYKNSSLNTIVNITSVCKKVIENYKDNYN